MATVVADADVLVGADVSKFARELKRKADPIIRAIREKISVQADMSEARNDVNNFKRTINRGKDARLNVKADVDFDRDVQKGLVGTFAKFGDLAGTIFSAAFGRGIGAVGDASKGIGDITKNAVEGLAGFVQAGAAAVAIAAPLIAAFVGLGVVIGAFVGAIGAAAAALVALAPGVIGPAILAIGALTLGFRGFDAVLSAIMSGKLEDFQKALEGLSPAAAAFASNLRPLVGLGELLQERLFAGLAERVGPALQQLAGKARDAFLGIADAANQVLGKLFEQLASPKNVQALGRVADATISIFQSIGDAVGPVVQGIVDAMAAAAPGVKLIGKAIGTSLGRIGEVFSNLAANGTIDRIAIAFEHLLSASGEALAQAFEELALAAPDVLEAFVPLIDTIPLLATIFADLAKSGVLTELFTLLRDVLKEIAPQIPFLAQSFVQFLQALGPLLPPLTQLIVLLSAGIFKEFAIIVSGIGFSLLGLQVAFSAVLATLGLFRSGFEIAFGSIRSVIGSFISFAVGQFNSLVGFFGALTGRIAAALGSLAGTLGNIGRSAINALASALGASSGVIGNIRAVGSAIQANIQGIVGRLGAIGVNAMNALADGLKNAGKTAIDRAKSIASSIVGAVGGILHIGSPSRVMIQFGEWISEGLALGIAKAGSLPVAAASQVSSATGQGFGIPRFGDGGLVTKPTLAMVGDKGPEVIIPTQKLAGTAAATTNISRTVSPTINVTSADGDPEALANRIMRRLVAVGV